MGSNRCSRRPIQRLRAAPPRQRLVGHLKGTASRPDRAFSPSRMVWLMPRSGGRCGYRKPNSLAILLPPRILGHYDEKLRMLMAGAARVLPSMGIELVVARGGGHFPSHEDIRFTTPCLITSFLEKVYRWWHSGQGENSAVAF